MIGIKCQIRFSVGNSKCWCQNHNWQYGWRLVSVWILASHCEEGLWFHRLTQLSSRHHLRDNLLKQEPIRLWLPVSREAPSPKVLSGVWWQTLPPVGVCQHYGDRQARWAGHSCQHTRLSAATSDACWRCLEENGVPIDLTNVKWPSRLEVWFI